MGACFLEVSLVGVAGRCWRAADSCVERQSLGTDAIHATCCPVSAPFAHSKCIPKKQVLFRDLSRKAFTTKSTDPDEH